MCDAGCGYNGSRDGSAQKLRDIISLIRGDNVVREPELEAKSITGPKFRTD